MQRRVAIVVGIAIGLSAVGLYWYSLPGPSSSPCNSCGFATGALGLNPPIESVSNGSHDYNFTVSFATSGLVWGDVNFALQTSGGGVVPTDGSGWRLTVFGPPWSPIASYQVGATTNPWTTGASAQVSGGESVFLVSPPSSPLSGDNLVIEGQGDYQGTISIAIP